MDFGTAEVLDSFPSDEATNVFSRSDANKSRLVVDWVLPVCDGRPSLLSVGGCPGRGGSSHRGACRGQPDGLERGRSGRRSHLRRRQRLRDQHADHVHLRRACDLHAGRICHGRDRPQFRQKCRQHPLQERHGFLCRRVAVLVHRLLVDVSGRQLDF